MPKRKALLVGVNDYQSINDLGGCINDVLDMHFSLRSIFGFETGDIRVLTDERATKDNILTRLDWLTGGAEAGDVLVFHFSGHGSQIRDREGEELEDSVDELICPYDMNWDGQKFITDDVLHDVFKDLPEGVILEVFMDCCHSGTMLRNSALAPPPELAPENPRRARFLPPPADIYLRWAGEEDDLKSKGFTKGFRGTGVPGHILWAGCKDYQTSADAYIEGSYHGAFTYYLSQHLRRDPTVTRKELLRKVLASLDHGRFDQKPQLETVAGFDTRPLFK